MGFQSQVNSILNQAIGGAMAKGIKDTSSNVENVKQAVEDVKTATEGQTEQLKQIAALPEREEEEVRRLLNIGSGLGTTGLAHAYAMQLADAQGVAYDPSGIAKTQLELLGDQFNKLSDKTKKGVETWYTGALKEQIEEYRRQKDYDENVANNAMKSLDAGQKFQEDQKEALSNRQKDKEKYKKHFQKKGGRR